ncbi:HlyD family secretion protein [uncultured Bacteroides sp.]|uniref:HlyD family secretion protein n=1 Tax=uncultured Bacteroides sp. TaxID=162156 RepID=UPI002605001C|nr:HlyD family secretion protein [uncultured Bacteroides sp.]
MENKNEKRNKINRIIRYIAIVLLVLAGFYIVNNCLYIGNVEYTENAQVRQLVVPVNNRVKGYIRKIYFNEFQNIQKGDTLLIIEDEQYILALNEAEVAYQKAVTQKIESEILLHTAESEIIIAESEIKKNEAEKENALTAYKRYENLIKKEAVTKEQFDNAQADYQVKLAQYNTSKEKKSNAILKKRQQEQRIQLAESEIKLTSLKKNLAKLNLSYTILTAPCSGVIGRKNIQEGQLVQDGQTLLNIVDGNEKWIMANFRESQIAHIAEGQTVEIKVDAFPYMKFSGTVSSLSDATGSAFSIVPQDNSTGNFVKVEQRIPVRIEFDKSDVDKGLIRKLRAGMNVECLVRY